MNGPRSTALTSVWASPRFIALLLVAVTLALFGPAAGFDATNCDDPDYFTGNVHIRSGLTWVNVAWAFRESYVANWHPLTWISLMADSSLSGNQPWSAHTTNLVLHALNTALLFLVLRRLTQAHWRSALVAALFAVHPTHVESVAWIAERKDVLSTFFGLLSLWCYAGWATGKRRRDYWLAVGMFALSLLSKSMLVTLPCLLLLLDFWPLRRFESSTIGRQNWRKLLVEKIPFFVLSGLSCIVTFIAQRSGKAVVDLTHLSATTRLENSLVAYVRYLGKLAWPTDLAVMYPYNGAWPWAVVIAAGFLLLGLSWVALATLRRRPFVFTGWCWFLGTLVPVIGLVQVGLQSLADRYTYVPSIGIFIVVVWGAGVLVDRWPAVRNLAAALALAVLVAFSWVTANQLLHWQNTMTLFRHAIAVTEGNYFAHNNLGCALRSQKLYADAIAQYEAALKIYPDNADVLNNYGYLYSIQNEHAKAQPYFEAALRANPEHQAARDNLAETLFKTGKFNESREQYREILRRYPNLAEPHNLLGVVLASQGKVDEAKPEFLAALKLNPDLAAAHCNLGNAYAAEKRFDDAIAEYRVALKLNPDYAEAVNNLGSALEDKGDLTAAMRNYRQALQLNPTYPQAHFNLGGLLVQSGHRDEGLTHLRKALKLKPDYTKARTKLAELGVALE